MNRRHMMLMNNNQVCSDNGRSAPRLTPEQKAFLDGRLREHAKLQPDIRQLEQILLTLGGFNLVAPLEVDGSVFHLINSGFVMQGPIILKPMIAHSCHLNASKLWVERKYGVVGIGSGYALTGADGLWRQHSWGMLREGIIETTVMRHKYFGVLYWPFLADGFAYAQYELNGIEPPAHLTAAVSALAQASKSEISVDSGRDEGSCSRRTYGEDGAVDGQEKR